MVLKCLQNRQKKTVVALALHKTISITRVTVIHMTLCGLREDWGKGGDISHCELKEHYRLDTEVAWSAGINS
jgi:hypothetical protein